ncbi:Inner membrane protein YbjJ [Arthrobacter saudimassiliensis]|uniref:Inner membrane protein YbjJ n=1 Tax=Arthrobacter saudimassiliensis TaxID=1461584 RepID=A0A078MQX8_9MICC|nr:Inner membrane protein YbjJ [Arthrobacter saudimassiliensis]
MTRTSESAVHTAAAVNRSMFAVFAVFALNGIVFASWAARIPAAAEALGIGAGGTGVLLLFSAIGSVIALPLGGAVAARITNAGAVRAGGLTTSAASLLIAYGLSAGSMPLTAAGLLVFGAGIALWDVAMNLEGADVERRLGRTMMPRFHAAFSGGSFVGALIGAGLAALGISLPLHLLGVLTVVAVTVLLLPRSFLPARPVRSRAASGGAPADAGRDRRRGGAWTEGRTLLIGVVVLGAALTEGAANDWVAKATVDGLGTTETAGALMFAVFVASMTATRWVGSTLIDRFGRVRTLRWCMGASLAGLLVFVFAPNVWLAGAGAVLWGIGAALGFPTGMSAAGEDPQHAAARVSVVSTLGYMAFFVGPPVLGFFGELWGIRTALLLVAGAMLVSILAAPAAREQRGTASTPE